MQWLLQNSWPVLPTVPKLLLPAVVLAPKGQKPLLSRWLGQGDGQAQYLLGLMLEQFLEVEGDGCEQHRFMGTATTSRVDPAHAVVLE